MKWSLVWRCMLRWSFLTSCLSQSYIQQASVDEDRAMLEGRSAANRYVFAHFMVGIVGCRTSADDWDIDMRHAKSAGIDAFALNIGTDEFIDTQLEYAYMSAANNGVKVFLSFDFAYWAGASATFVGEKIAHYASLPAQLQVDNRTFVSSFYGDGIDVNAVRAAAGPIFFAPNFHPGSGTNMATVDAVLNWMGWPNNGDNRAPEPDQSGTIEVGDAQYISAKGLSSYVAPVSPWFFTHYGTEASYSKNWLLPGDQLWFSRWTELLKLGPRFIEIVSWNDYGESHYVGPLSSPHEDDGASKWVNDMPHNGWLDLAKPYIAAFKDGATSVSDYISTDQMVYWYRPQLMEQDCHATDNCMGSSSNSDFYVGPPNGWQTVSDNVFVVTLLPSPGVLTVSSGGIVSTFNAPSGACIHSAPMGVGQQRFTLTRSGVPVLSGNSMKDIINGCVCGIYNFNAYVGTIPAGPNDPLGPSGLAAFTNGLRVSDCSPTPSLGNDPMVATIMNGTLLSATSSTIATTMLSKSISKDAKPPNVTTISANSPTTASYKSSVTITKITTSSSIRTIMTRTINTAGKAAANTSASITGTLMMPNLTVCTSGSGDANYAGLCSFCCQYGYCPAGPCTCHEYGFPPIPPATTDINGTPADGLDDSYSGLCSYACNHGYCPRSACKFD